MAEDRTATGTIARSDFASYRTALITGASSGIGAAFGEALALAGLDLVLVARSEERLQHQAKQLAELYGIRASVIPADLAVIDAGAGLRKELQERGLQIDLLVNNAGFGTAGRFERLDAAREQREILLNVAAVVDLTHALLPSMLERGYGGVINVASLGAFQPLPYMAVYGATKAFVLSFSEALRAEYESRNIRIHCLCPGPVDTGFFEATGNSKLRASVPKAAMQTPAAVVAEGLKSFKAGRAVCVPGYANKCVAASGRFLPRRWVTALTARIMMR